jgi:hypothetical protein
MTSIVERCQKEAIGSKEMMHVQFFGERVIFYVEDDQCHFFEDEETHDNRVKRP